MYERYGICARSFMSRGLKCFRVAKDNTTIIFLAFPIVLLALKKFSNECFQALPVQLYQVS